jgi:hypothetical protein
MMERLVDGSGASSCGAEFGPLLAAALPECEMEVMSGETRITDRVRDDAELFGLLGRLRDFGASLGPGDAGLRWSSVA